MVYPGHISLQAVKTISGEGINASVLIPLTAGLGVLFLLLIGGLVFCLMKRKGETEKKPSSSESELQVEEIEEINSSIQPLPQDGK